MKKFIPIICVIMLIVGSGVLLYPTLSNLYNKMTSSVAISDYKNAVEELDNTEITEKKEAAIRYNNILSASEHTFDDGEGKFSELSDYTEYFSVGDILGFISIPKINVYLPIYSGDKDEALNRGVWLMENTSIPIGGKSTHAGLSAHRGLPSATLFSDLDKMAKGDMFYIYILNESLAYKVDSIEVVLPEDVKGMNIVKGEDYVTLVTCTPYGINTHRLLVRGTRVAYTEGVDRHDGILEDNVHLVPWIGLGAVLAVVAVPLVIVMGRKKRKKYSRY